MSLRFTVPICFALALFGCTKEEGPENGGAGQVSPGTGGIAPGTGGMVGTGGMGSGGMMGTGGMGTGGMGTGGMGTGGMGTGGMGTGGMGTGGMGTGGMGTGGMGTGGMGTGGMMAGTGGMGGGGMFTLTSTAVMNGQMIPAMHRCASLFGAAGPSPPLAWTAGPPGTMSYTLIFKDTSPAGTAGRGTFHWIIKNIPMATMMLPMAVPIGAMPAMPSGAVQVANGLGDLGYRGPCGGMNQYTFTLYAVNKASIAATTAAAVETEAMANNVGMATLMITSMP